MNILIVTQYFWPENFRINDLAEGFVEKGHNVTVLTGIPNYPSGKYFPGYGLFRNRRQNYKGVEIIRTPIVSRGKSNAIRLVLNYFSFALMACVTGLFQVRGKYDAIFVFEVSPITVGIPAIFMKWLKKAPILFWVLDLWPDSLVEAGSVKYPAILSMVGLLVRAIYKQCDLILVQSRAFISHVQKFGAKPEKIKYFPSWAEDLYLSNDEVPGNIKLPQGFRVMFAGNIGVAQDFDTILDAAELLKDRSDIQWVIIGDGRMFEWVRLQVVKRGLSKNVHLLGRYPIEMMPAFFGAADALLVSLKRAPILSLTIPGKVQPYLASGKPIIAMLDGEGARIINESGAGVSCAAEDPEALKQAVLFLDGQTKNELELMGIKGQRYYEVNFSRSSLFNKLASWMQELSNVP